MSIVIVSTILVGVIGISLGMVIGATAKAFAVESDPRIGEVAEMLPGANCGACGFAGCADFAKALVSGTTEEVGKCPVCSASARNAIAAFLGFAAGGSEKKVAVVLCGGDREKCSQAALYNGINDCRSAALVANGAKGCRSGCLGLGTCARACPFGAIEITENGLAVVHPEICVGCGKCVSVCPRGIIKLVPEKVKAHIFCSSPEKGPAKKKFCSVPCIACRKCVKAIGEDKMLIKGFLVQINYDNPPEINAELITQIACPTGCLRLVENNASISSKSSEIAA